MISMLTSKQRCFRPPKFRPSMRLLILTGAHIYLPHEHSLGPGSSVVDLRQRILSSGDHLAPSVSTGPRIRDNGRRHCQTRLARLQRLCGRTTCLVCRSGGVLGEFVCDEQSPYRLTSELRSRVPVGDGCSHACNIAFQPHYMIKVCWHSGPHQFEDHDPCVVFDAKEIEAAPLPLITTLVLSFMIHFQ
jgi:hypothetical protein